MCNIVQPKSNFTEGRLRIQVFSSTPQQVTVESKGRCCSLMNKSTDTFSTVSGWRFIETEEKLQQRPTKNSTDLSSWQPEELRHTGSSVHSRFTEPKGP